MSKRHTARGQGLVEFALILPALLLILFSIIEGAFLFQAYLAVQHAAREAARYAVTYQPPITYSQAQGDLLLVGGEPGTPAYANEAEMHWYYRRSQYIRERAYNQSMGIRILFTALGFSENHSTVDPTYVRDTGWNNQSKAGFFGVQVWGFPSQAGPQQIDHPGLPGLPVQVIVQYRWAPLDPIIAVIVPNGILLTGEAAMINEGIQVGMGAVAPPTFAPTPTPTVDTSLPTSTVAPTSTPTPTHTPAPTPTYTPTPAGPYIVLSPYQSQWLQEEWDTLPGDPPPDITMLLYNHPTGISYRFFWNDNCGGPDVDLGFSRTTNASGEASEPVRSPLQIDPGGNFHYLSSYCGNPIPQGRVYVATLKTKKMVSGNYVGVASVNVPIYVPLQRPDLKVQDILFSPPQAQFEGGTFVLGVVMQNTGKADAIGTFDLDIYVNPAHAPLKGMPGLGTAGGSSPKQWWTGTVPANGGTQVVNFVVTIPPMGEHTIWAQVDTSDLIDETDDENNIFGVPVSLVPPVAPKHLSFACSDQCDDFSSGLGKWNPLAAIGTSCSTCQGSVSIYDLAAVIAGTGASINSTTDGKLYFLYQGTYSGDFSMTIQVLERPTGVDWAKAGLMVRESTTAGARYVAIGVTYDGSSVLYQSFDRMNPNTNPTFLCTVPIPATHFDGNPANGEGVWLRIVRQGNVFTKYTSLDGESWSTDDTCMKTTFSSSSSFAANSLPGLFLAPY